MLFAFYLVNIIIAVYLFRKNSQAKYLLDIEIDDLKGKINLLNEQDLKDRQHSISLQSRISRYHSLKDIIESINQNLDLDSIADTISSIVFSLIANNKGICIIYLLDSHAQKLHLYKAKRESADLIIKAKEGDIFDFWVLRHASALIVEDVKNDFRFDLDKLDSEERRLFSSLISSPFISSHRLLGIIRLDHPDVGFYTQDDLRFLMTISDIGAVAIENGEYFKKTQELAIHDGLTSFYTKGYFLERLKEECHRSMHQNTVFSLLMLDIDYFKNYNDKFGHTAGDIVLKSLSRDITDFLKDANTFVCRFGGEEFCIILFGKDKKAAYNIAEDLRKRIENTKIFLRRQQTSITVSIGVSSFPDNAKGEDELISQADLMMYKAKEGGRNKVAVV